MVRGQVSIEYFFLVSIIMLVGIGVVLSYMRITESTISSFQSEASVQKLNEEITRVFYMRYPATRTVRLEIPNNVISNRTFIANNTIQISYYDNGIVDVFESLDFNVSGYIPNKPGVYWLKLFSDINNTLQVMVIDFDVYPDNIALYLPKFGEKEYNITLTNTGNQTISVSALTENLDYLVDLDASTRYIDTSLNLGSIVKGGHKTFEIRVSANKGVGNYYGTIFLKSDNVEINIPIAVGIRNRIFPVNTTIIPLDSNQVDVLKAYGFAYDLLSQEIPVGWVMNNITINTTELGSYDYEGSVFVIDSLDVDWIISEAASWGVTIHHLNQSLNGDFVTWLAFAPRVAVHSSGKYWVVTSTLNMSGIPYDWVDGNTILNSGLAGYDVLLVGHYDFEFNSPNPEGETSKIEEFVVNGGYLHAECVSITSYEKYQNSTGVTSSRSIFGGDYLEMFESENPLTQTWGVPKDIGGTVSGLNVSNANVTVLSDDNYGFHKFVYSSHGEGYISYFAGHLGDSVDINVSRMRLLNNVVLFTSAEKGKTGPLPQI
ncbi:MAG: hypothetical protein GON13_01350 [Nanoarchaeota archaeon]|nr:hypothetical protein [Nanoarchaeota archaeon]